MVEKHESLSFRTGERLLALEERVDHLPVLREVVHGMGKMLLVLDGRLHGVVSPDKPSKPESPDNLR